LSYFQAIFTPLYLPMKSKILTLFLLLALAGNNCQAQLANIKFGASGKETKFNFYPFFLGSDQSGYYVMRMKRTGTPGIKVFKGGDSKSKLALMLLGFAKFRSDAKLLNPSSYMSPSAEYYLEKYDNDLALSFQKDLILPDVKNEDFLVKNAFFAGGKVYLFSTTWYSKLNKTVARIHEIDMDGKFGKATEVGTIEGKTKNNESDDNTFECKLSANGKHIIVFSTQMDDEKKPKTMTAMLLDPSLAIIWKNTFEISPKDDLDVMDITLDDKGHLYATCQVFYPEKEAKNYSQKFFYKVFYLPGTEGTQKSYELNLGADVYVSDLKIVWDDKGNPVITGFYSEKSANKIKGFYSKTLDPVTFTETGKVMADFDTRFQIEMEGAKKGAKGKEISDLHIRKMFPNADGTITFIAEKYWIEAHDNNNNSMIGAALGGYNFYYNYEDILLFNMTIDGKMNWVKKVLKYQRTYNDGGLYNSFITTKKGDDIFLVYNAHRSDPDEMMVNTNKAIAYVTKVDKTGKATTEKLFNAREAEVIMTPRIHFKASDSKIIIHNIKDSEYKYAEVNFQ